MCEMSQVHCARIVPTRCSTYMMSVSVVWSELYVRRSGLALAAFVPKTLYIAIYYSNYTPLANIVRSRVNHSLVGVQSTGSIFGGHAHVLNRRYNHREGILPLILLYKPSWCGRAKWRRHWDHDNI